VALKVQRNFFKIAAEQKGWGKLSFVEDSTRPGEKRLQTKRRHLLGGNTG